MRAQTYIKRYRETAGLTQKQLSDKTGIPLGTIRRWEQGGSDIRNAFRLAPIADAIGCTVDDLLGRGLPKGAIIPVPVETVPIPVYGRIAAGVPIEMIEVIDEAQAPITKREKHPYAYFLIVSGDSMNNEILDGHLSLIDPKSEVHNGDTVAVNVNGYDATLKVWHKTSNSVILSPNSTNGEHKDIVIDETSPEAPELRVLGKKVWAMYPE
jgi:repressor LexA